MGHEADAVAFFDALVRSPYRFDFYQTLRRLECLYLDKPRWGQARRPVDEPVRFGQDPELSFASAPLGSFDPSGRRPRLEVRLFGLFGPNGPLPMHLTEYARERLQHAADPTLSRFLDIFHHRLIALFYRAWAQAQPCANRDRPNDDRFTIYVGAFVGMSPTVFRDRDRVPDLAKFFHACQMIRGVRNAEGLSQVLRHFFRVPVDVDQFVGHWLHLRPGERTMLATRNAQLGVGAVIGSRVWDRQHKFRLKLGPLTLEEYESFLPGGRRIRELVDWVRTYLCFELDWDVQLLLKQDEVPSAKLGGRTRLGWTTWLGTRRRPTPAGDLCLDVEQQIASQSAA